MIILEAFSPFHIMAALIPTVAFLALLLYFIFVPRKPKAKIIETKAPIFVVGISTVTNKKTFIEDDIRLFQEFKKLRDSDIFQNRKEERSLIAIRKNSPTEGEWEYMLGSIVHDLENVVPELKTCVIPAETYAAFTLKIDRKKHSWAKSMAKMEKYVYQKWLPKSKLYELNRDTEVCEIQYHDRRMSDTNRKMIFYLAVKSK